MPPTVGRSRGGGAGQKRPRPAAAGPGASAPSRPSGRGGRGGRGGAGASSAPSADGSSSRRRPRALDEEIDLDGADSDDDDGAAARGGSDEDDEGAAAREEEGNGESADAKRLRLARDYLQSLARSVGGVGAGGGRGGGGGVDHLAHASHGGDDDEEDEEEDEEEARGITSSAGGVRDAVTARLRAEAQAAAGTLFRPLARELARVLREGDLVVTGEAAAVPVPASTSSSSVSTGVEVVVKRGHDVSGGKGREAEREPKPARTAAPAASHIRPPFYILPPFSQLPATSLALTPDGRVAYTGSKDCSIVRWAIGAPDAAPDAAVTRAGKYPGRGRTKADVKMQLAAAAGGKAGLLPVWGAAYGGGRLGRSGLGAGAGWSGADGEEGAAGAKSTTSTKVVHSAGGVSSITVVDHAAVPSAKASAIARSRGLPDYGIVGHWDEVLALSVSSDGAFLASGGRDKTVRLWDGAPTAARSGAGAGSSSSSSSSSSAAAATAAGPLETFVGHKDAVLSVAFRPGSHTLLSGGQDRMIKIWSADELAHIDTLFGHQDAVLDLAPSASGKERCLTAGRDKTARVWKISEQSQLVFRGHHTDISLECVRPIGDAHFVTGSQDGTLSLWNVLRKRPIFTLHYAHGTGVHVPTAGQHAPPEVIARRARAAAAGDAEAAAPSSGGGGDAPGKTNFASAAASHVIGTLASDNDGFGPAPALLSAISDATGCGTDALSGGHCSWITAMAVLPNSDVLATGSGDGFVRLWRIVPQGKGGEGGGRSGGQWALRGLEHVGGVPLRGIVTGLAWAPDGRTLVASVGQEHRLGRWWRYKNARNGIAVLRFKGVRGEEGKE
jgi:WD40 repeat protein